MDTLYDLITKNLKEKENDIALENKWDNLTYGELSEQIERIASFLHDLGVKSGDRVGIHMKKCFEEIVITFAISRIGAIFVNINHQQNVNQLRYVINDCQIHILFTDSNKIIKIYNSEIFDLLDYVIVCGGECDLDDVINYSEIRMSQKAPYVKILNSDIAALIYTSGSTGKPKGVILTHQNILLGARSVSCYLRNTPKDKVISLLPISFDYGLNQITTMFLVGGTVFLQGITFPVEIANTIISKKITGMAAVPYIWLRFVSYLLESGTKIPSLRYITNSGGSIPKPILKEMPRLFPGVDIYLMYGLTEAFRSTYLPPEHFSQKMGAIGQAIPNAEVFVVDSEKGLCGPGEQGELLHRGNLISKGYWKDPEATAGKIRVCKYLKEIIGDEKVLYSGDIVSIDSDNCLWFVGRNDRLIKCNGHRISPTEIEDIVYQSKLVKEVVAFGMKDHREEEVIHVAVNMIDSKNVSVDNILQFCRKRLARYMVPAVVYNLDKEFPLNSNGKVDVDRVIALCMELS